VAGQRGEHLLGHGQARELQLPSRRGRKLGYRCRRERRVRPARHQRQRRVSHQEPGGLAGFRRRPQLRLVLTERGGELGSRSRRARHAEGDRYPGRVRDVSVAFRVIQWERTVALVAAQEAVSLRDVHPQEQVRVIGPVRAAVRAGADDVRVDPADLVDGPLGIVGRAVGRGRQEGAGPLEPAPRVVAVVGVLRDRDHRLRVQ
jgi:hypothetical protein